MIISEVIPITYAGGTGGAMLSQFLIKAKNSDFSDISLSEHGHAHWNDPDIEYCGLGVNHSDMEKITHLANAKRFGKTSPYFSAMHLVNIELCKTYFDKIIRITYTKNDILDLSYIFVMKNLIDIGKENKDDELLIALNKRTKLLTNKLSYFNHAPSDDKILYVAWDEIYNGDVQKLINRLADFTDIQNTNFNEVTIKNWRQLTNLSLNKIKSRI
jgi:hypothetical protein